jgi:hypothetical protein
MNLDMILALVSASGSAGLPLYLWRSGRKLVAKYDRKGAASQ